MMPTNILHAASKQKFKIDFRLEAGDIFCLTIEEYYMGGLNLIQTLK